LAKKVETMQDEQIRRIILAVWRVLAFVFLFLLAFPITEYGITRALKLALLLTLWGGALWLWWRLKPLRITLLALAAVMVLLFCLPARKPDPDGLRQDYRRMLQLCRGARYAWGAESPYAIDCSGLARKGMVWGWALHGLRRLDGTSLRGAADLWWHDASALALRDGYRGLTRPIGNATSLNDAPAGLLLAGDLAVSANGLHVLIYLGNQTWIEADPGLQKVVEITTPSDNLWFNTPVVFVRWNFLDK
jgi:hypothetical protein